MAADVELFGLGLNKVILWVPLAASARLLTSRYRLLNGIGSSILSGSLQDYSMHTINGATILVLPREEFLTTHCTGYNIADQRVSLWQVCSEVHLLPIVKDTYWLEIKLIHHIVFQLTICTSS